MPTVYLGLGTNLGNKTENLHQAVKAIEQCIGRVIALSSFYETAPWGFESAHTFLNAAIQVETTWSPEEVLIRTQQIERDLGRLHKSVGGIYHDRPIDIDLLLYDNLQLHTPTLTLPHPGIAERLFVLRPLAEIAPNLPHPISGITIRELLQQQEG